MGNRGAALVMLGQVKVLAAGVFAAGALLLLGGCQTTFDLVGVAVPLTASQSRVYDGSYQGTIRNVAVRGPNCPDEHGERVLMVGDGVLWYAYNPTDFFAAAIESDGGINATAGDAKLAGKIVGDHLDATVTSSLCQSHISMNYVYNHS